jgi:hypothetical protein
MLPTQSNFNQLTNNPLNTNNSLNNLSTLQTSPLNLAAQPLQGASQTTRTFTVTNTNATGNGSLQQAILNANADSVQRPTDLEVINFILGAGPHTITLGSTLDITAKNLTINGTGANVLTISGGNTVQDFKIETGTNVTISGLTIANGVSTVGGGGILNNGTLTLNTSTLNNDNAISGMNGGAIFNNGTLIASGDTFTNNNALTSAGGAIFSLGTATINNSSFTGNRAINGGAVEGVNSNLTITNSTFTNNSVVPGGVGGAVVSAGNTKVTITGSSFTGNTAIGGAGGAIYNSNTSTLKVMNSSLTNSQSGLGAAIYNSSVSGAIATALGLSFSGNVSNASNGTPGNNNDTFGTFVANVDTLADTNDGNFTAGHLSLRNAINGAINGETINFASNLAGGTITLTLGELDINKSLTIQGLGADKLTVSGNNKFRDFNIASGANVTISGLDIINGNSGSNQFGGGIYNQGILTLAGDIIKGNTSDLGGGGIFNNQPGTLILANTTVSNNTGGNGGGLENVGGNVTIAASLFTLNTSPNGLGGAISNSGTLNIVGATFDHNSSVIGGGALFDNGTATIANSAFNYNTTQGKGGAIDDGAFAGLGSVTVKATTFFGNTATQAAGVQGDTPDIFGPVQFA